MSSTSPAHAAAIERGWLGRTAAFWSLAAILGFFLAASAAPSPLYPVYQAALGFSAFTLTEIFAIYVVGLLAALIFAGSLSDVVGRRPVLLAALAIQLVSMGLFLIATDVGLLLAARLTQGVATGLAMGAMSGALVDLAPPGNEERGPLVASIAPLVGLAVGALGAGLLVEFGPDPVRLIFWLMLGLFALAVVLVARTPETVAVRGRIADGLRPRLAVPPAARAPFVSIVPVLIATWALGGLYLSLGPSVVSEQLGSDSHVTAGLVIVCLASMGALGSALARNTPPRTTMLRGAAMLVVGVGITLVALNVESIALFFAGSIVAGLGFGPSFGGAFRGLMALAPPDGRAGLSSAILLASYASFSIPATIAGIASDRVGLLPTANVYGALIMCFAAIAIAVSVVRTRRAAAAVPSAG
ncbi:MFS transporter [Thermoleophilia bacterium SCSIO 60948]|nr:MFS transporter [Thermoleophilia bacterium SCSIO 60948]